MEPKGNPFRRPPPRPASPARRSAFGPIPAAPLSVAARSAAASRPPAGGRPAGAIREPLPRARGYGASASAFYLVAALALVGAALALTGHEPRLIVGLGMTRLMDDLAAAAGNRVAVGAVAHAAVVAGFALLGLVAQRGRLWASGVGAAIYALDGLIVLAAHDWVAVAIHTVVLVMIVRGLHDARRPS